MRTPWAQKEVNQLIIWLDQYGNAPSIGSAVYCIQPIWRKQRSREDTWISITKTYWDNLMMNTAPTQKIHFD
jgi:hypothetical protein